MTKIVDPANPSKVTPRPPSTLPPPGNFQLELELDEFLGRGQTGLVYSVNAMSIHQDDGSADASTTSASAVPPLVVKVARRECRKQLAHEAWIYEEMESLQGVCIPRCYGLFDAVIHLSKPCRPWVEAWMEEKKSDDSDDEYLFDDVPNLAAVSLLLMERLGGFLPIGKPLHKSVRYGALSARCAKRRAH